MSRRMTLYIGDRRADLADDSPILLNWTREDLDNPTVVRNSYTRQVTLPATPANDAIFGAFHRVDRAWKDMVGECTGAAFNPLKKAPFALYDERSEVVASGYAKLDAVALRGEQAASYTCSLYGGLGSLFYDLDTAADGSKRTLADLIYGGTMDPASTTMSVDRLTVAALWDAGVLTPVPAWGDVVTFAPCYNGLPAGEFDANKAIVTANAFYNFPSQAGYTPAAGSYGNNPILATFADKHTEWEVRDFRAWLQRPVVSVKAVLEALADPQNTGEWTLALDGAFFTGGSNPWYDDAWMTLPLLQRPEDGDWTALHLSDALGGTMSPAAFLIGYAKMFGLVFAVDEATRTVTLMTRDDYYDGGTVHDLTERIDRTTIDLKPVNASARWYEMKAAQVDAAYTKEYEEAYGRVYGSQRIDTGWEFDADVKDLLPSFPFKGAADVLETSPYFYVNWYNSTQGLAIVDGETVKYKLYDSAGNAKDFDALVGKWLNKTTYPYNAYYAGHDVFPKVQLHGTDGKASDGAGVLLIRTGEETLPDSHMDWHLSDDDPAMAALNDGRPCWVLADTNSPSTITSISKMPSFRRMAGALTMDFGAPRETAVPSEGADEGATVYFNRWRGYLSDRLDVDTKVMTCKVLLDGMRPGAGLLRDMYWYRSALWSLNRIKDYAPALDAPTECEFVQVRDADHYTASQAVPEMETYFLNASPASLSYGAGGEAKAVTISSNVAWTLSAPAWITASAASGTGNATVTLTASPNGTGTPRTGTVTLTGAHGTGATVALTQAAAASPTISVTPTTSYINASARLLTYTVSSNASWRATSSEAWAAVVGSGEGSGNGTVQFNIAANTGAVRTATITFTTTSGSPTATATASIRQSAPASTVTYALELGASSHTFSPTGGSYTLTAQGVTYTNGVETSRVSLAASALSFVKSGSDAVSRSGLTFSAADLGDTNVAEQTTTYTLTWTANGSQATFTAKQSANVVTWSLVLGAASHAFAASGGTYTLTVKGRKTRNGTNTDTTLSASALTITRSGSTAISRSGLTFSAADLAFTPTAAQSSTWAFTWNAHTGATGSFTTTQEANERSVIDREADGGFPNIPATLIWNASQSNEALAAGDSMALDPTFHYWETATATYTSRPGEEYEETETVDLAGAVQVVSGDGLAASGSGSSWTAAWAKNTGPDGRSGSLKIKQTGENPYMPGYYHEETRSVTQAGNTGTPSKLLVQYEEDGVPQVAETTSRTIRATYVQWTIPGHTFYSALVPAKYDSVYSDTGLHTVFGTILDLVY